MWRYGRRSGCRGAYGGTVELIIGVLVIIVLVIVLLRLLGLV
jgi:hypothetical protein